MTTTNMPNQTVLGKLVQPLLEMTQHCVHARECKTISDKQWLKVGVMRTLSNESTGRGFLQSVFDSLSISIKRNHYFEALKSERRLRFCQEIGGLLFDYLKQKYCETDPFSKFSSLDGYDIYAGDGHYHAASAHDTKKDGKKYPVQHFYALDLRTHALKHLIDADVSGDRKKEHDMRALKRLGIDELRQNAPKGRKVIYVWDRAGIDFRQWYKWKQAGGIYFISREKDNMKLSVIAKLEFNPEDDINTGVLSHELVETSCGVSCRRIRYKCPVTGKTYSYLTNLTQIPPGLIAYLYKLRWDVEKVFDEVKNKMEEKKSYAKTQTAKTMQAEFICLAHNLMLIMENDLKTEEGIKNEIEFKRKQKRLNKAVDSAKENGVVLPIHLRDIRRFTQRSIKFIRWLRNNMFNQALWRVAVDRLRVVYADF